MSIVSLHNATLMIANQAILDGVDWQIQPQDKIALVGRNGAGKSSLLKLLEGNSVLDQGQIQKISGLRIAGLVQDVPISESETVYHFLVKSLGQVGEVLSQFNQLSQGDDLDALAKCQQKMDDFHAWDILPRVETMASRLGIDIGATMNDLSGGMKRRVLLAAALIAAPDLLLLDEPTNHLDLEAIEWLETYLKNFSGSVILVTHDRAFLGQVARRIVELDRGKIYVHDCDYETYLDRREANRHSEQKQNDLFDKKLAEEEVWIRTGVKARRTRNEGRVRALKALREEYKARRNQLGSVKSINLEAAQSGAVVIEAEKMNYSIGERALIKDFSLLLTRGAKLGIIGPNGCGKTTLVRLLLGELHPDSGVVKQGTGLKVAYFDQLRRHLNEEQTVLYNVAEGADYVEINGKQKHVASYLKDFLFAAERFNQPVSVLSGGEKNRLMLAKLLAKPVNFLVMDEPTNDLDIETLELLEQMLVDYSGTLIIISHDRAFIDQVVTSVLIYEGNGQFNEYVGGYGEYQQFKKLQPKEAVVKPTVVKRQGSSTKLSFNEQRELSQLPLQIEQLEAKLAIIQGQMAEPGFYQQEAQLITSVSQELSTMETQLAEMYARWEALEDRD